MANNATNSATPLRVWLVLVACLRVLSVVIGIAAPEKFKTALIDLAPELGESWEAWEFIFLAAHYWWHKQGHMEQVQLASPT
jgi:hypothetical protein